MNNSVFEGRNDGATLYHRHFMLNDDIFDIVHRAKVRALLIYELFIYLL